MAQKDHAINLTKIKEKNMPTYENIPVNEESLPRESTALLPLDITTSNFEARLKEGGTIALKNTTLTFGDGPQYNKQTVHFVACDTFSLEDAKIVTNGNVFILMCNRLITKGESGIFSFENKDMNAAPGKSGSTSGEDGKTGKTGDSGGSVTLHIVQDVEGALRVDLSGQNGGQGGNGYKGARGAAGSDGTDAQDGVAWCAHGGQGGGNGGRGLQGGSAGDGGAGGHGGVLQVYTIGDKPIPDADIIFTGNEGKGGKAGSPGEGGNGGPGGDGGSGSRWCDGGPHGSTGPQGPAGENGSNGSNGARSPSPINKAIDIEVSIRQSLVQTSSI